jgi:preprotein translocase subunit SecF
VQGSASSRGDARRKSALILSVALLVSLRVAGADEVYKSVDAQGHVVYSDRAATSTAQKSVVRVIQPDPTDAARAAKETSILQAEENQRKRVEGQQSREKSLQDQEKQRLCENARNRYFSVKDANLLYKLDAQGNRVFYTDAEADARKEQAHQAMLSACGK